ncbi:MAG: hypothetical protein H0X62_16665, partial [Bacteroidetes bacterium]|nr:hypothetical protein [Bacteroidota bacterium]
MSIKGSVKKVSVFALKFILWAIGGILGFLLLILILIQLPPIQRMIGSQTASYLSNTIGTPVTIDQVSLLFPKTIAIKEIYVEGQQQDTLLYSQFLQVDISLLALLDNTLQINSVELENTTAHLYRTLPDSTFNFDFIIDAFVNGEAIDTPEDTTAAEPWNINFENLELHNIYFTFNDELTQSDLNLSLKHFNLDVGNLDLEQNQYIIGLAEISGLNLNYAVLGPTQTEDKEEEESPELPLFKLDRLRLDDILVNYSDANTGQDLHLALGMLGIDAAMIDLASQKIDVEDISLANTNLNFTASKANGAPENDTAMVRVTEEVVDQETGWVMALKNISLKNIGLDYNNLTQPEQARGLDFNHLSVSGFTLIASNILYSDDYIQTDLEQLTFQEKSGFSIDEFSTNITIAETKATFADFILRTGSSKIAKHFEFTYPSISQIGQDLSRHSVAIDLDGTSIGIKDLIYLSPELAEHKTLLANIEENVQLSGKIEGPVSDLLINRISVNLLETKILVNGAVKGMPNVENAVYQMDALQVTTTRENILTLVPDTLLPEGITIPQNVDLKAVFNGSMENFNSRVNLTTSLGNILANVKMKQVKDIPSYAADVSIQQLNLGILLQQPETMGKFEMTASVNGSGLTPETMRAEIAANVSKAEYNQYQYNNLEIDGLYLHQQFNG